MSARHYGGPRRKIGMKQSMYHYVEETEEFTGFRRRPSTTEDDWKSKNRIPVLECRPKRIPDYLSESGIPRVENQKPLPGRLGRCRGSRIPPYASSLCLNACEFEFCWLVKTAIHNRVFMTLVPCIQFTFTNGRISWLRRCSSFNSRAQTTLWNRRLVTLARLRLDSRTRA
jgi:hypothetical protein